MKSVKNWGSLKNFSQGALGSGHAEVSDSSLVYEHSGLNPQYSYTEVYEKYSNDALRRYEY
jgi:hypothetical protein